jgi:hypothetical protein
MITFYANNLVDQSTLTASSENLLFPLNNVKDQRRTKVFRSNSNSTTVVFDTMETSEMDSFIVVAHTKLGFGISTLTIEANATDDWSSPPFTTTVTLNTKHGIGITELATPINYRFVRFVMTSTLGYCELSKVFIGKKTVPSRGLNYNWTFKNADISSVKENRYGQKFSDIIGTQRIFSGLIQNLDDVNLELLLGITDIKGLVNPFFVKIGCQEAMADPYRFISMVFFSSVPTNTNRHYKNWGFTVALEEAQ